MVVVDHLASAGDAPCDSVHHHGRVSLGRWASPVGRQALESLSRSGHLGLVQGGTAGGQGDRHQVAPGWRYKVAPHGVEAIGGLPDRMLMVHVDLGERWTDEYRRLATEHLTRLHDAALARILEHYWTDLAEGA